MQRKMLAPVAVLSLLLAGLGPMAVGANAVDEPAIECFILLEEAAPSNPTAAERLKSIEQELGMRVRTWNPMFEVCFADPEEADEYREQLESGQGTGPAAQQSYWMATRAEHADYGGDVAHYYTDLPSPPCDSMIAEGVSWVGPWINDRTSSTVAHNYCSGIRLFQDADYLGTYADCSQSCPRVPLVINDQTSSFVVYQ